MFSSELQKEATFSPLKLGWLVLWLSELVLSLSGGWLVVQENMGSVSSIDDSGDESMLKELTFEHCDWHKTHKLCWSFATGDIPEIQEKSCRSEAGRLSVDVLSFTVLGVLTSFPMRMSVLEALEAILRVCTVDMLCSSFTSHKSQRKHHYSTIIRYTEIHGRV